MTALRAAELETLFTANVDQIEKADKLIRETGQRVEKNPIKVNADAKGAIASMDRVEATAKRLVSQNTAIKLDADISRTEFALGRAKQRLEDLQVRALGGLDVTADVRRAEAALQRTERTLDGLRKSKTSIQVDADMTAADEALAAIPGKAGKAGADSGDELGDGIVAALASIPIAGAIAGIAYAAGKAVREGFQDGLQIEVRQDRLEALTGISEAAARRFAFSSGEAYANGFGESIEQNMDTARLALQFNILDEKSVSRDAQRVVSNLGGIADVLGEEVRPAAQAVAVMIQSGIAKNAQQAFDILAAGAREGVNRSEDLLDTFTEYPALFARLGLTGEEALGLINQGLDAGAFNSDKVADALKELQIRATDASETSAQGYRLIGLNAEEMTAKMAAGGKSAREGLDQILDGLRNIDDPVQRNIAGVALVGTQWEDLGDSILALDLTTAVDQLNGVEGAAQRMFDTLADNDASKIERAQRNIEVGVQGIQGALAAAFTEPLGDFADWVSQNRGPVMQFFLDVANGALDFADAIVEGVAAGTEGIGDFVAGPLADLTKGLAGFVGFFDKEAGEGLDALVEDMRGFDETTATAADNMRDNLGGAIDEARGRLNDFGEDAVAVGYLNDASLRLADSISQVDSNSADLEAQVRAATDAIAAEQSAADAAGESHSILNQRYVEGRQALEDQMVQTGMSREAAKAYIDELLKTPSEIRTQTILETARAQAGLNDFVLRNNGTRITVYVDAQTGRNYEGSVGNFKYSAMGGVYEFMAAGGLTPMAPVAQMVPANTWRVVGDRSDVSEAYIPIDGSARSMAILLETMRRFGMTPMAGGGVTESTAPAGEATFHLYDSSGQLLATMRGVAQAAVSSRARGQARALRHGSQN